MNVFSMCSNLMPASVAVKFVPDTLSSTGVAK